MALALNKKIFLCSAAEEEFSIENTVNFYQLPGIVRLVGTAGENNNKISSDIIIAGLGVSSLNILDDDIKFILHNIK